MREVFDLLSRIQQRTGINLLIIGAWALQVHGYSRNTSDVDCMTAVSDDTVVGEELSRAGFECFAELPAFRRFQHRSGAAIVVDVMRVDGATFEKMWKDSEVRKVEGFTLHFPSLAHLVALKLHAAKSEHRTDKDLNDVREVLRANPGALSPLDLQQLCDRFGTPGLARGLAEFL